jgi:tetratricopeptide (TPR) repeat protein
MKFIFSRITAYLLFALGIFIALCAIICLVAFGASNTKSPDAETIRIFAQASDAYAQGFFTETAKILHEQKNFAPSLILRAKAEYFSGDWEKAETSCRRAIKLRSSSLEANLYLARILREKNNHKEARIVTEALLADNPQDIRVLRLAAELSSDAGKYDEALIFLDRAAECSAECAMALLDRARLRWVSAGTDETALLSALDDLNRAKAMLPWDTPLVRSISNLEKTIKEVL